MHIGTISPPPPSTRCQISIQNSGRDVKGEEREEERNSPSFNQTWIAGERLIEIQKIIHEPLKKDTAVTWPTDMILGTGRE